MSDVRSINILIDAKCLVSRYTKCLPSTTSLPFAKSLPSTKFTTIDKHLTDKNLSNMRDIIFKKFLANENQSLLGGVSFQDQMKSKLVSEF